MIDKHSSTQFDNELTAISSRVLEMGRLAESQLVQGVYALCNLSGETASEVLTREERINQLEIEIDGDLSATIARRQPTAGDLRFLTAVSKIIANLERVGDEAARIARTVQRVGNSGMSSRLRPAIGDIEFVAELAAKSLEKAVNAFAALDMAQAVEVLKDDNVLDKEFDGLIRKLITYMMEDPRTISGSIDLMFVAKAIERVGDHAKNLSEQVIYVVKGADVRHNPIEAIETIVR